MRISKEFFILGIVLLAVVATTKAEEEEGELDDVGFDDDDESDEQTSSTSSRLGEEFFKKQEVEIRNSILSAVKQPEKQNRLSQVLPIIRSMSTPQKRAMAILVSSRRSNNDSSLTFDKVEEIFGADRDKNITRDLMLPISMDIAKIISDDIPEELPEAQELRYYPSVGPRRPMYQIPSRRPLSMIRRNVHSDGPRPNVFRPGRRPTDPKRSPTTEECTFFSSTICLEAMDYPHEAIMRSIRKNREMITALLADYKEQNPSEAIDGNPIALPLETRYENKFENNEIKRRSDLGSLYDNVEEGFTCPSQVKYARPQLARAASGSWKYIINTGEHTQTLRLEKCAKPLASCSFVSENYRSSCIQVFNYHRLLTWDSSLGLHMDIFKVPTCCSCHVHGYSDIFPPHRKNPPLRPKEKFPGADFATEDESNNFDYTKPSIYGSKKSPSANFGPGYLNDGPSSTYLGEEPEEDSSSHRYFEKKPPSESTPSRPTFTPTIRPRPKKPSGVSRPFDNLPQQHAPNTRAPGYTGSFGKIRNRPNRPFRRDSNSQLDTSEKDTVADRYSQQLDQEMDATTRIQTGTVKEEQQEPHRRVNYNYHPIIDFFEPEASKLQAVLPQPVEVSNAWKPMISP